MNALAKLWRLIRRRSVYERRGLLWEQMQADRQERQAPERKSIETLKVVTVTIEQVDGVEYRG